MQADDFKGPDQHLEVLCFRLSSTEFGLDMLSLVEVVNLVEILRVDTDGGLIEGVINYRGMVTPVIDVRRALGFPPIQHGPEAHIIITDLGQERIGLIVDKVLDVLSIPQKLLEQPGARIPNRNYLHSVAKLADRMLLILDVPKLVNSEPRQSANGLSLNDIEPVRDPKAQILLRQRALDLSRPVEGTAIRDSAMIDMLHFALGDGEFVIQTDFTKEIVSVPTMTPIPCTPHQVMGAINIRGVIMPVLDVTSLVQVTRDDSSTSRAARLIVLHFENDHIGLLVDHVFGLCSVSEEDISPPLVSIEEETARIIAGEFDLEDRAVCVIRVPMVFNHLREL